MSSRLRDDVTPTEIFLPPWQGALIYLSIVQWFRAGEVGMVSLEGKLVSPLAGKVRRTEGGRAGGRGVATGFQVGNEM